MPAAKKQVPRSTTDLLNALEDHLSTLVRMMVGLQSGDAAHLKDIAIKLRLLVGGSSGQVGFLWDLGDAVLADDSFEVRYQGKVDPTNPLTYKLQVVDNHRLANLPGTPIPIKSISLRKHITAHEAVFVDGISLTYKDVIKEFAEHAGTAHETPGVSREMAKANAICIGDVHPFIPIVDRVARWTLSFGEAVIQKAVQQGYIRRRSPAIAPPEVSLESRRFEYPLTGPMLSGSSKEGSIIVWLSSADFATAKEQSISIQFPPMSMGNIRFDFQASRKGRLRVSATGLLIPYFGYECNVDCNDAGLVAVGVTWRGLDVRVYINGRQVSGPTGT